MVALCSSYDLGPLYRVIPDCKQQAPALSRCGSNHLPGMTSISYNHCTCIVCCVALPSLSLIEMIRLLLLIVCRLCLYGSLFVVSFPFTYTLVQACRTVANLKFSSVHVQIGMHAAFRSRWHQSQQSLYRFTITGVSFGSAPP